MKQPESILLAFAHVMNNGLKHLNPELQKIRNVLKDAEEAKLLNIIEHNGERIIPCLFYCILPREKI